MGRVTLPARGLVAGTASGRTLVLDEPLSLWGGLDPATGMIVDAHHPPRGSSVSHRVLVMPAARGSSSSASVLAEAVRAGTAPAAIVLGEADLILAVGATVAAELYGVAVPVVVVSSADLTRLTDDVSVTVEAEPPGAVVKGS